MGGLEQHSIFGVSFAGTGGIISSGLKGSPEKKPDVSLGADGSGPKCMLVLSGGEGYIDFRIGELGLRCPRCWESLPGEVLVMIHCMTTK